MPHYVIAGIGDVIVKQVVHYSSAPPASVMATWAAHGMRMVRIRSSRASETAREIARAPHKWQVLNQEVVSR